MKNSEILNKWNLLKTGIQTTYLIVFFFAYFAAVLTMMEYENIFLPLKHQSQQLSSALSSACDFKSHFCKQCGPRSDCSSRSPHCLPVCKNRFEKFARIFGRRHKQTTFSDAGFLGILRVKTNY